MKNMINPEIGFTSDVIKDPKRFVGRTALLENCISAINSSLGVIAIYGKRGVGKSSLLRQLQQMALGDYLLAKNSGLTHLIPQRPRKYLTVYYQCDSMISNTTELLSRLCNDQNDEDGLLRLVPDDGKEVIEFTRSKEVHAGADLKVVNWGAKGLESTKYAKVVPGDIVQTFRNFLNSIVNHQVKKRMKRDGLLILLDEFDVIQDKSGVGSLFKSLSSNEIKFAVCGIGRDISTLVHDHGSIERLLEQGSLFVRTMSPSETEAIINKAQELFDNQVTFAQKVKNEIVRFSEGYPYFVQMLGKECVAEANRIDEAIVTEDIFNCVLENIRNGRCFPNIESTYQRAIGNSEDRQLLLHLLADQKEERTIFNEDVGRVFLRKVRKDAEDFDIKNLDQNLPRLIEKRYGPILEKIEERPGVYEFTNPIFRLYVRLRNF
jgi:Cdc6-like AAA superfamily ATPase